MTEQPERIALRIGPRLHKRLSREATKADRSLSWVVRRILAAHYRDAKLATVNQQGRPRKS